MIFSVNIKLSEFKKNSLIPGKETIVDKIPLFFMSKLWAYFQKTG